MLHSLELENFKAFGERAHIPFAPITLIFGENSAGKSTILQALNLLKQTRESRETGALLLPRAENGIVDLGSFHELLFDHDPKRTLSIHVETTLDRIGGIRLPLKKGGIGIEFSFNRPAHETEVRIDRIKIYHGKPSKCIAEFQPSGKTIEPQEFLIGLFRDSSGLPLSKLAALECVWITDDPDYWEPEFKWCKKNQKYILQQLEKRLNDLQHSDDESQEDSNKRQERLNSLKDGIEFLTSDFDLITYTSKRSSYEINTVLGLQGFLPIRIVSNKKNPWISELLSPGISLRARIFDVALLAETARRALEQTLKALFPMGPFRRPPERWYIFTGTSPQDVGYKGDLLPDLLFRRPELVDDTNEWLKKLDMGYKLDVKSVGANSRDLFEVRLVDIRRKKRTDEDRVDVALPDVGFGISQLLPFVVQSLISEKQIISIEQPEVHVHPRLQADLGDLLAEAIKPKRGNQFIIETHSEHLVLRLQRLIYEKKIKPEQVSVIYVSRGPEGAEAQRLLLDEEGDFVDDWPDGFFPERLRELR